MTLGQIIRAYREENSMSMDSFAKASGLSKGYISQLENNEEHEAMVGTLKSLAAALNVPVSKLFTQKD